MESSVTHHTPDAIEQCTICISDLSAKCVVTLVPCRHRYHESCAREWLEKQEEREAQTCPICRTHVELYDYEDGVLATPGIPYGETGEPTIDVLCRYVQPATLLELMKETQYRLSRFEKLEKHNTRGVEYVKDVQEEKEKMAARLAILQRMKSEFDRGEWQWFIDYRQLLVEEQELSAQYLARRHQWSQRIDQELQANPDWDWLPEQEEITVMQLETMRELQRVRAMQFEMQNEYDRAAAAHAASAQALSEREETRPEANADAHAIHNFHEHPRRSARIAAQRGLLDLSNNINQS